VTPSHRSAAPHPRLEQATRAVADLIAALGLDPATEPELEHTPERVARFFLEAFRGTSPEAEPELVAFDPPGDAHDLVVVRDLRFYSLCVHHFVPFFGRAHIAYVPGRRMLGISAPARVLHYYAARPQLQERLGRQVAEHIAKAADARGVAVALEARHLCMEMRGVRAQALVQSWVTLGEFAEPARDQALRAQLLRGA
jgi:GTP cyclohydrolase IA